MARIRTNTLLHPTKRIIENWKGDFRTSDGPNTSAFIKLDDLGIPYDSHYLSRIVLPAYKSDFLLNYGSLENFTFLVLKVTYNGNYDNGLEDDFDPLYYYEPNTYNINYYFGDNTGVTYSIGQLLILNGSLTNKLPKIYLNNPLDYDVVLELLQADISESPVIPPSSAITISNLYYNDIITNQIVCTGNTSGMTTTTTTTFLPVSGTTTTTTTLISTTTTTIYKEFMSIIRTDNGYYKYSSSGYTIGLFDYYKDNEWVFAGEEGSYIIFTDLTGIDRIRFYFELNDVYYGLLKTNLIDPIEHNNGLYFVDVDIYGNYIPPIYVNSGTTSTTTTTILNVSGITYPYTGSTEFIISEYTPNITGYTITTYVIPYDTIVPPVVKDISNTRIYINTTTTFYTLIFLTEYDCTQAYNRIIFAYNSYLNGTCAYLTSDNAYNDGVIVDCLV
jgi:hypothetical protein